MYSKCELELRLWELRFSRGFKRWIFMTCLMIYYISFVRKISLFTFFLPPSYSYTYFQRRVSVSGHLQWLRIEMKTGRLMTGSGLVLNHVENNKHWTDCGFWWVRNVKDHEQIGRIMIGSTSWFFFIYGLFQGDQETYLLFKHPDDWRR